MKSAESRHAWHAGFPFISNLKFSTLILYGNSLPYHGQCILHVHSERKGTKTVPLGYYWASLEKNEAFLWHHTTLLLSAYSSTHNVYETVPLGHWGTEIVPLRVPYYGRQPNSAPRGTVSIPFFFLSVIFKSAMPAMGRSILDYKCFPISNEFYTFPCSESEALHVFCDVSHNWL